eukprot:scaffold248986_cov30-Tisochrysis_lutea.AAC.4
MREAGPAARILLLACCPCLQFDGLDSLAEEEGDPSDGEDGAPSVTSLRPIPSSTPATLPTLAVGCCAARVRRAIARNVQISCSGIISSSSASSSRLLPEGLGCVSVSAHSARQVQPARAPFPHHGADSILPQLDSVCHAVLPFSRPLALAVLVPPLALLKSLDELKSSEQLWPC